MKNDCYSTLDELYIKFKKYPDIPENPEEYDRLRLQNIEALAMETNGGEIIAEKSRKIFNERWKK